MTQARRDRLARPFERISRMLSRYGFSAAKAAEILLDAKRGDAHARAWIGAARAARP